MEDSSNSSSSSSEHQQDPVLTSHQKCKKKVTWKGAPLQIKTMMVTNEQQEDENSSISTIAAEGKEGVDKGDSSSSTTTIMIDDSDNPTMDTKHENNNQSDQSKEHFCHDIVFTNTTNAPLIRKNSKKSSRRNERVQFDVNRIAKVIGLIVRQVHTGLNKMATTAKLEKLLLKLDTLNAILTGAHGDEMAYCTFYFEKVYPKYLDPDYALRVYTAPLDLRDRMIRLMQVYTKHFGGVKMLEPRT